MVALTTILYAVLAVLFVLFLWQQILWLKYSKVPGPIGWPLVGHVPMMLGSPYTAMEKLARKYGRIYKLLLGNEVMVVISDPEAIKQIVQTKARSYLKHPGTYQVFSRILGEGLVTSEKDKWKMQRTRIAPAFHFEALGNLFPVFHSAAGRLVQKWSTLPANSEVEVSEIFRMLTLEVISEAAVGLSHAEATVLPGLFVTALDEMNIRVWLPFRAWLPTPSNFRHIKCLNDLDALVLSIIRQRRADIAAGRRGAAATDFLDMLIASESAEEPMTEKVLSDELKTMLLAGHETTSMALTWSMYMLALHEDAKQKVLAEIREFCPEGAENASMGQVKNLEYTGCVIKEAMRIFNPVPIITRTNEMADTLCDIQLPAGTSIALNIWGIHRDPEIWGADVQDFRPERFYPEETKNRHPFSYLPFSLGPRNCLGQNFALLEAKTIIIRLLSKFDFTLAPGHPPVTTDKFIIPVRPAGGLYMLLTPRA